MSTTITIPPAWNGPPRSGNGGVTAGLLAAYVEAPVVAVTLRRPPPLGRPLAVVRTGAGVELRDGAALLADAAPGEPGPPPPEAVPYDAAERAAASYAGLVAHPFPTCFGCGPARRDGLRLAPGPIGPGVVATPWVGPANPSPVLTWVALDCPGGWTADLVGRPMVLGRMTGQVLASPAPGERCVVVGRALGAEGRKAFSATAAYGAEGRLLGAAWATWLTIDPASVVAR